MSTEKTWETQVSEARAVERPGASAADVLRAELACRAESAHERAVRAAEKLAADAQRLASRLAAEGIGAICSGNGFLGEALALKEALVALEGAREAFGIAIRVAQAEQDGKSP